MTDFVPIWKLWKKLEHLSRFCHLYFPIILNDDCLCTEHLSLFLHCQQICDWFNRCQSWILFFIDLNRIKEAKSRKVFSLSSHLQKNSVAKCPDQSNQPAPPRIGSKIKIPFEISPPLLVQNLSNDDCCIISSSFFAVSTHIFETGFRRQSCIRYVFITNSPSLQIKKLMAYSF